jgi:hypothetical protein
VLAGGDCPSPSNPTTWEAAIGELKVQDHHGLYSKILLKEEKKERKFNLKNI